MPIKAKESLLLGSIFLVLAFLANTIQSVFGKLLEAQLSVEMFTWVTFISALIILIPIAAARRFRDLKTEAIKTHLVRGGTGMAGFLLFIDAAQLTSLINANVLLNTTPIFIPILALIFLKTKINRQLWIAIGLGFTGMIVIVRPDATLFTNPGNILGLAAGFVTAIEFLAVKRLDETDSPITQMIYFLIIGSLLSTILVVGKLQPINHEQALIMLATGGCLVCFQFLLIKAYTYAKPHEIGAFQYSSVVFAAFLGWILFKEQLDLGTIIGTVLICAGGILSISKLTEGKKS